MLGNFLRAKYHWERGESEPALRLLHELLSGSEAAPTFYLTPSEVERDLPLPFEIVVTNILLTEDVLSIPFDVAFAKLWDALPVQYLVLVLCQRTLDPHRDRSVIDLLLQAAGSGLISVSRDDYDLSGKVVLDPDSFPEIIEFLGGEAFLEMVAQATATDAWRQYIAPDAARLGNLFLYAVFQRERPVNGEMVLIRLEHIADSHPVFLHAFADHLAKWLADAELVSELVSIGMRLEKAPNPRDCLQEFADAIASAQFEPFVRGYYILNRDD